MIGPSEARPPERGSAAAVEWFQKAAAQGLAGAQFNLGVTYANGLGVEQSDDSAVQWFQKAAEQGHTGAQFNLGVRYANGQGVEQSDDLAVEWFQKAAEQGLADAQFNLGSMCAEGRGVAQSDDSAVQWFQRAAEQGDADAQFHLGNMYVEGRGVPQSDERASEWFRRAAERGDSDAQNNLGIQYAHRHSREQSDERAREWFRRAAEHGDPHAQNNLGVLYANGQGVEQKDESDGKIVEWPRWLRRALEQGHTVAQGTISALSLLSRVAPKSPWGTVDEWFSMAAMTLGHPGAFPLSGPQRRSTIRMNRSGSTDAFGQRDAALDEQEQGETDESTGVKAAATKPNERQNANEPKGFLRKESSIDKQKRQSLKLSSELAEVLEVKAIEMTRVAGREVLPATLLEAAWATFEELAPADQERLVAGTLPAFSQSISARLDTKHRVSLYAEEAPKKNLQGQEAVE